MSDSLAEAASRLEAAIERLAEVARRPRPSMAEVASLSARLESAIARLRSALPDGSALEEGDLADEPGQEPPHEDPPHRQGEG